MDKMSASSFIIFLLILHYVSALEFKMKIASLVKCMPPEQEADKDNEIPFTIVAYKRDRSSTRMRANFTIPKKFGPFRVVARSFEMLSNNVESFVVELNMTCTDMFVVAIMEFLKFRYTPKCELLPGNHILENLDIERFAPFMIYAWRYGRYGCYVSIHSPKGIVACLKLLVDFLKKH